MKQLESNLGTWVLKYRLPIILATILIVCITGSGVQLLTFNRDLRVFFGPANPQLQALEALENTYTKSDDVMFVLAPTSGNVFTRETLSAIEELTARAWQIPYSNRVDSITNYQHAWVDEDDLFVNDLVKHAESLLAEDLNTIRNIALDEPLLLNRLLSSSGHVTAVIVTIFKPGKSNSEVIEIASYARQLTDELHQQHPDIKVYLTGSIMFDNAYGDVSQDDVRTLSPMMFGMLVFLMAITLRSVTGILATFIIIGISIVTGMGLAGWMGMSLNPASANAPLVILTLAVADSVHILTTIFQRMFRGDSKAEAISESLRINLRAVFLTSITTAIGFLTMNFSDAPPFRDLGNIVAMGVIAALGYSVIFLPALLSVLPLHTRPQTKPGSLPFDRLATFVINTRTPVFWIALLAGGIFISGMIHNEFHDDWIKYFDKRYEIRTATDFSSEQLTGFNLIEYSLESGKSGGINEPEYLTKVEEFATWFRQQPKVVHVTTFVETMTRLNKIMHGGDKSYYRIPERRDLAAQYLLLYELSLPSGLDLNNQINIDKSATRMTVFIKDMSTRELRELEEKAQEWLKANAPESMFTSGSGLSMMWAHISERNIKSMLVASFGALILISGILIFGLRSVKLGLLSLIPNIAPALMAFGLWGFVVGKVGLGLSVVVALTLGIVVDDTIHFLTKYLQARREYAMEPIEAIRYTYHTVGMALWTTTIVLVGGFLVLMLSGYGMNSDMGLLVAITLSLALALDFLFLPTLILKIEDLKKPEDRVKIGT